MLTYNFRGKKEKKLIFHLQDHAHDDFIANLVKSGVQKANGSMPTKDQMKIFVEKIKLEKLKMIATVPELGDYQAPDEENCPKNIKLFEWLVQTQNQALGNNKPVLADFSRPILMEMLLLPDRLL